MLRAKANVDPRFLAAVLHSRGFLDYAVAGITGVQHPRTSWAHIREFEVPALTYDEQRGIADLLWLVHDGILASEKKVAVLEQLSKALLHKLMTGEVRVGGMDISVLLDNTTQSKEAERIGDRA